MWLTLPMANKEGMEDVLYFLTNFHLCMVTDELGRGTTLMDVIFQGVDKLPIRLDAIDITYHRFTSHKELGSGDSTVNGRCIRIYSVSSYRFIPALYIQGWIG